MSRPRILIPVPTSFDEAYNSLCWPEYAAAVYGAGGEAVELPLDLDPAAIERLLADADGVLLPGSGADVDPARYGHVRQEESAAADLPRERTDFALIEGAGRSGKPLLGICFGTQSLNVYHGGTLIQDVTPVPVNHSAGRAVSVAHFAEVAEGSLLAKISAAADEEAAMAGATVRIPVNSSHHQALAIAGEGLRVVAACPEDGVIEAVEGTSTRSWLLGVQWHPERTYAVSAISRAIFSAFLSAARNVGA